MDVCDVDAVDRDVLVLDHRYFHEPVEEYVDVRCFIRVPRVDDHAVEARDEVDLLTWSVDFHAEVFFQIDFLIFVVYWPGAAVCLGISEAVAAYL